MNIRTLYKENYRAAREAARESKSRGIRFGIVRVLPKGQGNFHVEVFPTAPLGTPCIACRGPLAKAVTRTALAAGLVGNAIFFE